MSINFSIVRFFLRKQNFFIFLQTSVILQSIFRGVALNNTVKMAEEEDSEYCIEIQDGVNEGNQEEMMVILDLDGQEMPESVTQAIIQLAQNSNRPISRVRVTKADKKYVTPGDQEAETTEFQILNDYDTVSSLGLKKEEEIDNRFLSSNAGNFPESIFGESNMHEDIFPSNTDTQILLSSDEGIFQQHLLSGCETNGHVLVLKEQPEAAVQGKTGEIDLNGMKNDFEAGAACLDSGTRIIVKDLIQLEEFRTGKLRQSDWNSNNSQTERNVTVYDVAVNPQESVREDNISICRPTATQIAAAEETQAHESMKTTGENEMSGFPDSSKKSPVFVDETELTNNCAQLPQGSEKDTLVHTYNGMSANVQKGSQVCAENMWNKSNVPEFNEHNSAAAATDIPKKPCSICSFQCENDIDMGRHMKVTHQDKHPYKCSVCAKSFSLELSFKIHSLSHINTVALKHKKSKTIIDCPHCSQSFTTLKRVSRHVSKDHASLHVYFCDGCKISFKSKVELNKHVLSSAHQNKVRKVTKCPLCKVSCLRLTKHLTIKHPNYCPYLCDMCGYSCKTLAKMKIHQLTHLSEKPFQCPHCGKCLKSKVSWSRHVKNHSSERKFSCDQCSFRSNDSYEYKRHVQRVHSKNKYYDCKFCNLSFLKACDLKLHAMSEHNSKDSQFCPYCDFSCETRAEMKLHRQTHTGENPFVCDQCGFSTAFRAHLERHQATHSDHKPFKCPECDYSCKEKVNLNKHMVIHRPEKPFACSMCSHRCKLRSLLNSHIRIVHSSLRPFACDMCNYTCKTASNLKKHQWIHQGYKPFACKFCPYVTREINKLRRHEKFKHKALIETEHSRHPTKDSQKQEKIVGPSQQNLGVGEERQQIISHQDSSELPENSFTKGLFRISNATDFAVEDTGPATERTFVSSRVSVSHLQGNTPVTDSFRTSSTLFHLQFC